MTTLELSCLGHVEIKQDGQLVEGFVSAKAQALLIYLAVTNQSHSRESLTGLFWGDKPENRARANLRKALSNLRQLVGEYVSTTDQTVAFNHTETYSLDAAAFEAGLAAVETTSPDLFTLREAVELYRGDFLAGFSVGGAQPFEEWVLVERERLRRMVIEALQELAVAYTARGEYAAGIEVTNRLLALEPWQEEAHRQLMTLLARSGQRNTALAQYETCRRILAEELGVEPLPETQALYHRLKTRREATPHNLPSQTTPFVGRQTELAQIAHYLDQSDCHLLTLIGVGGIGKTRLALQAARQALDTFADGVYFVSLAGISSAEFLVSTIGEALGYPLSREADPKRQLLNYLDQKEMLLVLDNFEHLLSSPGVNDSGRELLLEMVKGAPLLKLLVTSRERLNLQAEWLLTVQGLPYPPAETTFGEETFEAVELFTQGAHRVQPDFTLSTEWPEVVRICRLLDGMPLGIELAATWVSIMPCAEIFRELSQGLELLSTTLHDVPIRHRSLEAVFDHSWQLLSEPERAVFKKLSVFRGGFDRQAATVVAGASLSTLAGLVNKSLLRVVSSGRYDMLEPLKQYAAGKLAETSAEEEQVHDRHCDYYASFLEQWENDMKETEQRQALLEITADIDSIRSSWGRAVSQRNLEAIKKSQESLWYFYDIRGWFQEGNEAFQKAMVGIAGAYGEIDKLTEEDRNILGQVLVRQGWFCWRLGRYEKAKQVLRQSLDCFRPGAPDTRGDEGFALSQLGHLEWLTGNYDEAKSLQQKSLAIGREIGAWLMIASLGALNHIARTQGEYAEAEKLCHEGIALCREHNDRRGEMFCLISLGWAANARGDYTEAKQWLRESLAIHKELVHKEINDKPALARTLTQLGTAAYLERAYTEAKQRYMESIEISKESGERWHMALALVGLGYTSCALGDYEASGLHFRKALQMAMEIGALWVALDSLVGLARFLTASNPGKAAAEQAVELLTFVFHHSSSSQEAKDRAENLLTELKIYLTPQQIEAVQANIRTKSFDALVAELLNRPQVPTTDMASFSRTGLW